MLFLNVLSTFQQYLNNFCLYPIKYSYNKIYQRKSQSKALAVICVSGNIKYIIFSYEENTYFCFDLCGFLSLK